MQLYGGNAVTLASTVMVTGAGTGNNNVGISNDYGDNGTNALTNQGTLQATAANTSLNINPTGVFTNAVGGVVQATNGGTVTIATTNWVNNGSYVVNAGTLNLTAGFATAGIGTITRTGGTISLQAILTNTSAALDVQVFGGNLSLSSGEILGGTLTSSGTARIVANNGGANTLSNVQINGNALDLSAGTATLQLTNSTNFTALSTFTVGGNSYLRVAEAITLNNLNLTLSGSSSSLQLYGGNAVTLASTVMVTGAGTGNNNVGISNDYGDNGTNALTNQGTLQATAANTSLNINPTGVFTNAVGGVVQATNGGTVTIATTNWVNNGSYVVNAGTLNLTAGFTTAGIGTITRTGGTISLQAILTNTSAALDVQVFGGNLSLSGGEILGGTLTSSGTARIVANNSGSNILSGVQISGNALDMSAGTATLQLTNGTNFTALSTFTVGGNSYLRVAEAVTLTNLNLTLTGNGSSLQLYGGNAVTLASTVMVTGAGTGNNNVGISNDYGDNGTNALTNQGTLQATAASTSLNINPSGVFTNQGTIQASGGGTVTVPIGITFSNFSSGTLTGGTYIVQAGSTIDFGTRTISTIGPGTVVTLDGMSSTFTAVNSVTTNNGTFNLTTGRNFTVTGGTLTNSGTLTVGNTAATTLTGAVVDFSGGVVQGAGTITGTVMVNSGGTLHPGNSPGILTIMSAVTLASGANFAVDLNGATIGTTYSQLNLTGGGSINLGNATLVTSLGYAPAPGDSFTIITGGTVSGIFNGLTSGSMVPLGTFQGTPYSGYITYNSTSVVLTPVPEPMGILAACAAATGIIGLWRRRC